MPDTNWQDFPDNTPAAADILLAMRGTGGVNFTAQQLAALAFLLGSDGTGKVGLGTSTPAAKLDVVGAIYSRPGGSVGALADLRADPTTGANGISLEASFVSGGYGPIRLIAGGSERVRLGKTGDVSIGTTNHKTRLNVSGAVISSNPPTPGVTSGNAFFSSPDNGYGLLIGSASSGPQWLQAQRTDGTAAAYDLWLNPSGGNIGIGTAAPLAKCHVEGTLRFTGDLILGGGGGTHYIVRPNVAGKKDIVFAVEGGTALDGLQVNAGTLRPQIDNVTALGLGGVRYTTVYAATGAINTSDERAKEDIDAVPDEWLDAWGAVEWVRYKFRDAVEEKGDDARWHVGLVAQRVRDIFAERGLDAQAIGLLCYDEWEEEREPVFEEQVVDTQSVVIGQEGTGVLGVDGAEILRDVTEEQDVLGQVQVGERVTLEAGDRWGLRYDECQAMEAAWQRRELARKDALIADMANDIASLSNRLAELEAA